MDKKNSRLSKKIILNLKEKRRYDQIKFEFDILRNILEDDRVKNLSKPNLLIYLAIYIDVTEKIIESVEKENFYYRFLFRNFLF